ncbi:type I restriction endonuclease [Alkalihalobacillus pseudalcaliphilus]|uniref:type I restriction endonuclease n=1 Tax=Alkalihalobacillus pseudalcaliphilus TaxID=79884 RepID=UPI00064D8FCD|nr:type I restriction endonuclease [Alkalihalobacillus pseudalcaliphilus]KMK74900.1 endonuclease [Alkalihalobacillus pseudalcaliphilus]
MGELKEKLKALAQRIEPLREKITTEEATKTSIIMPFFQILGYDIFNPSEFTPEYIADVGIKKGEKVDFAIVKNDLPVILIEAKSITEELLKHDSQLFRYFGTTTAKFAILTNGTHYKFFTDLDEQNKMDNSPFFEFNLLDLNNNQISELEKFKKDKFNVDNIFSTASELKYTNKIKTLLFEMWDEPSDEFITFILNNIYDGRKTKNIITQFTPIVKQSLNQFINELVNKKLSAALKSTSEDKKAKADEEIQEEEMPELDSGIVTTEEEIQGFGIAKIILSEIVNEERVFYRDNKSYFNILIDDNIRKWICRLGLDYNKKYIQFNDGDKTTVSIDKVTELMLYKGKLLEVARSLID